MLSAVARNEMPIRVVLGRRSRPCSSGIESASGTRGVQVVGEASDGQEVVRLLPSLHPDVAVWTSACRFSWRRCGSRAPKGLPKNKDHSADAPRRGSVSDRITRAGVKGYVLKSQAATDLVHAIQQVSRGAIYLSPAFPAPWWRPIFPRQSFRGPAHVAGTPSASNLSAKGNQPRRCLTSRNQREDGGVAPVASDAETGHP